MKRTLLTASLLAGISMAAAPAMAQVGHIGVGFGNLNVEVGAIDADNDVLGVDGSFSFPTGGLVLQVNGAYSTTDGDAFDIAQARGSVNLGVRNDQWAAGGYIGVSSDLDNETNGLYYGGEFVFYMPQVTLAAGAGLANFDDADVDATGFGGEARFFASDNLRIDGRVGFQSFESTGGDADGMTFGIGGEWKPDNFPVSIFGGWDQQTIEDTSEITFSGWTIGARFDFGSGTLKARDRSGVAFRPVAGFDGTAAQLLF